MPNSNKLPDVLTEAEQESLLSQPDPRYPTGQRNYTLLRIMLDTGLRSSEAVSLKWEHVNLMSGKLMVNEGKGVKAETSGSYSSFHIDPDIMRPE